MFRLTIDTYRYQKKLTFGFKGKTLKKTLFIDRGVLDQTITFTPRPFPPPLSTRYNTSTVCRCYSSRVVSEVDTTIRRD